MLHRVSGHYRPTSEPIEVEWNFPVLSNGTVHFRYKGCWVLFFRFYSNFNRKFCKQTVETLIRRRVLLSHILKQFETR